MPTWTKKDKCSEWMPVPKAPFQLHLQKYPAALLSAAVVACSFGSMMGCVADTGEETETEVFAATTSCNPYQKKVCTGSGSTQSCTCQNKTPAALSYKTMWNRHEWSAAKPPTTIPLLIVYVKWVKQSTPDPEDTPFPLAPPTLAHPTSYYENMIFGSSYPSANKYFAEVSRNRFQWSHAASYGPMYVTLPTASPWAENHLAEMIYPAMRNGFDFGRYDTNHDGKVTPNELTLMMISDNGGRIAGANRGFSPTCLPTGSGTIDHPSVEVCSETGIGVAEIEDQVQFATLVHEMSHTLGTEDLYGPFQNWDYHVSLMGPTIDGGPDFVESYWLDPWHRHQLGWTDDVARVWDRQEMGIGKAVTGGTLPRGGAAFLWDSKRSTTEYFILEYRNRTGYDRDAWDTGIAVWYVNENSSDRSMRSISYSGLSGSGWPGVSSYFVDGTNVAGTHGGSSFLKQSNGFINLRWANGSSSGLQVAASNSTGGFQILRTK